MADVAVQPTAANRYRVTVTEGSSSTTHEVSVNDATVDRSGTAAEELVAASFRFLLDREPKEAILRSFDLDVIGRYFPEYPDRIGDYL